MNAKWERHNNSTFQIIDVLARGSPGVADCGGIFRNHFANFLGNFSQNLRINNSFIAELWGVILVIEIAHKKSWLNLWLECNSSLVVQSFKNPNLVPWKFQNRWHNYINLTKNEICGRSYFQGGKYLCRHSGH